jgi:hypothetical protein
MIDQSGLTYLALPNSRALTLVSRRTGGLSAIATERMLWGLVWFAEDGKGRHGKHCEQQCRALDGKEYSSNSERENTASYYT